MTVYVDNMRMRARVGRIDARWSHLTADTDEELHAFAAELGLKRAWFQPHARRPEANHYDVTDSKRAEAIAAGAVAETMTEGARRRRAAAERRLGGAPSPRPSRSGARTAATRSCAAPATRGGGDATATCCSARGVARFTAR